MGADNVGVPGVEAAKRWRNHRIFLILISLIMQDQPSGQNLYDTEGVYQRCNACDRYPWNRWHWNYQVKTSDTDGQEVVLEILDANGNEVAQAKRHFRGRS